jgi:hypothetical protein
MIVSEEVYFLNLFDERHKLLMNNHEMEAEFKKEMNRFLSSEQKKTLEQENFWSFIVYLIEDLGNLIRHMS